MTTLERRALQTLLAQPEPTNAPMTLTLPLPPSVNAIYYTDQWGKRRLTSTGKEWKALAEGLSFAACHAQRWRLCCHSKVVVELYARWPDARDRDMNNLHKLLADALQKTVYLNDRQALLRDMDFQIDRSNPRLELKIHQMKEEQ